MTCGPWRAVRLETYDVRISDVRIDYEVSQSLKSVSGSIVVHLEGCGAKSVNISATAVEDGKTVFKGTAGVSSMGHAELQFRINDPKLWYPHGYGKQTLYEVVASVSADSTELDTATRRVGFRKSELVQQPDEIGKSFYFRVNGIDIFCGGSDWIPADSFTPRISKERYRKWLQMMVDGYQVMIR